ncbi:outer membrane protein assembly factor BamB family protein [Parenemella sanctibonifatiensis]|uniref:Pyrrolo-quinoline quinone repeat domain-containing protein n=1 Tax=Parenemella sanctibonifatiensis TaxID=2016505 RepID=A0A255EH26_9ACTN|nr:PQQ-binding-like beta-propeller repeat protein [Parenemella sanctibonifatiensis]OYN90837.1 hypothetical protein CGZ91_04880 [Parenemella sanctibonifatiensis]
MQISRRTVLGATGLAALAVGVGVSLPGRAQAALAPEVFGPASLITTMRGATAIGNQIFMTTRYLMDGNALRVVSVDVSTGATLWQVDLEYPGFPANSNGGGNVMATDGDWIYVGPAGSPVIMRLDPATGAAEEFVEIGVADAWFYRMVIEDGSMFVGTFPDGGVHEINLATRAITSYGAISASKYCNSVAITATHVYGGANAPGGMAEWPRGGGEKRDISAYLGPGLTSTIDMVELEGIITVASGETITSFDPEADPAPVVRRLAEEDNYVDALTVTSGGDIYGAVRNTGNLYRVDGAGLELVATPLPDDASNLLVTESDPGTLIGVGESGRSWIIEDGGTPKVHVLDPAEVGYPEQAQYVLAHSDGRRIYVAGHGQVTIHDRGTKDIAVLPHVGECKSLVEAGDGTVYAAQYPGANILRVDEDELVQVSKVAGQYRPALMAYDEPRNQLIVTTGPHMGGNQGAVAFIDLATGEAETRTDILVDQTHRGLWIEGDIAYLTGGTYGEGTGPIRELAEVAALDLTTGEVLWRVEPRSGVQDIERVVRRGDVLYVMTRRPNGDILTLDPATGAFVETLTNLGGYGGMDRYGDRVLAWVHWALDIVVINPDNSFTPVFEDVPRGWYNNPNFSFVAGEHGTWGMDALNLAFFPFGDVVPDPAASASPSPSETLAPTTPSPTSPTTTATPTGGITSPSRPTGLPDTGRW